MRAAPKRIKPNGALGNKMHMMQGDTSWQNSLAGEAKVYRMQGSWFQRYGALANDLIQTRTHKRQKNGLQDGDGQRNADAFSRFLRRMALHMPRGLTEKESGIRTLNERSRHFGHRIAMFKPPLHLCK